MILSATRFRLFSMLLCVLVITSCAEKGTTLNDLKAALTLHSSFDDGVVADFALGDKNLYTVPNRHARDSAQVGLHKPDIKMVDNGKYGGGLLFTERSRGNIYYPSTNNIVYSQTDWSGAISFWLSLDPATDLEPGFCDPIQITDVSYNDAAIWVDFTRDNPRDFRLGVIGDRKVWNPELIREEDSLFLPQLAPVKNPPFAKNAWTHVLINFSHLNTDHGKADLYMNGELKSTRNNITDPFTWDLEQSNIYLGLSYIGLYDELSIFNKPLSETEISVLYNLENGMKALLE